MHYSANLLEELTFNYMSSLISPQEAREKYPLDKMGILKIEDWRRQIRAILSGDDHRFLAIVGPCSVHDEKAAMRYFERLSGVAKKFSDRLFIVGRSCFEKPRTRNGWEGAFSDWDGDNSGNIGKGIGNCRNFLLQAIDIDLPLSTEILDQNSELFFSDLLSLSWVGARTTEAMTLRRAISGMPMPVGIKNATSGDIVSAIDAIVYASSGKNFLGINVDGRLSSMSSSGNPDTFLIMRGGKRPSYAKRELEEIVSLLNDKGVDHGVIDKCRDILGKDVRPNYSKEEIDEAVSLFTAEGMKPKIVVDSSHGNSQKNHLKQAEVWRNVVEQRVDGNSAIVGAMIESYNESGSQKFREEFSGLNPDISITDACLGIEETEELLQWTYEKLS